MLKEKILIALIILVSVLSLKSYSQHPILTEQPVWAGMWYNCVAGQVPNFTGFENGFIGRAARIRWRDIEPQRGIYDFSLLKSQLEHAADNNYYYYFELWTGFHSPTWISDSEVVGENTVPWVQVDGFDADFPYYLDPDYKIYVKEFFNAFADGIASFPQNVIDRLIYIQPGFGSTGDRGLYKGDPIDPQYNISDAEYVSFMKEMTQAFTGTFARSPKTANIRFLWNIDDYDGDPVIQNPNEKQEYAKWMKDNYNCQLRKQQYTIAVGYFCPDEKDQDDAQRDDFYGTGGRWGGAPEFIRGEFNEGETAITPLFKLNPFLFYYWTAISSVDRGLDAWEVKVMDTKYLEAYEFSNRYSYYKVPETSPHAFIALRDILDYSDKNRFPESIHGSAYKGNQSRVESILSLHSTYGAQNNDMSTALESSYIGYLRDVSGYNDCLWNVIDRNNQRFITQIDPNNTSAGYWRVGLTQTQPYGRFCRGFDVANHKNTMYFDVNDNYFEKNRVEEDGNLRVKIIHYAKDGGSWELQYHAQDSTMKSIDIVNDTLKDWVTTEINLIDALLNNGGEKGADLILQNKGNTNCRFHLIELTIPGPPVAVEGVSIKSNSGSYLTVGNTLQLEAIISPNNAENQDVTWTSLNPEIATVDSMGLVTAVAIGTTTLEVTTIDGGFTSAIDVEVITGDEDFVLIKSPATNDEFYFGQAVKVIADGYDSDGIERMRFRVDGGNYNNVTDPPYEYTFTNLSLGTHTFEVQMKDSILPEAGRILSAPVTIKVIPAPSSDATLSDLSINDTTLTDFSASKEVYDIELPEGTSDVPVVTAIATDVNADVQVTNAEDLPGTASILVTAEDGVTTKTYTINFTFAAPTVGINDRNVSNSEFVKVYPNPVKEFLNIDFATTGGRKIDLFNSYGQIIYSTHATGFSTEIDLKPLNIKGLVILQVKSDNSVSNHKVIVK